MQIGQNEVQPIDIGDHFLPWLQRIQAGIQKRPTITEQRNFACGMLMQLSTIPLQQTEFMVSSGIVLGKAPDCTTSNRLPIGEGCMFFGRLATFGFLVSKDRKNIFLSASFDNTEAIDFTPSPGPVDDFRLLEFEVPIPKVTALVSTQGFADA